MRKRRLVYKRDSDGRFARVNSLVGKVSLASRGGKKLSLAKQRKSKNQSIGQVLDARVARGNLSYAVTPAKELSAKYDLTGPDLSETNQKAYREAGKIARQLKLKYGDEAPSANLIYRIAKNIQLGTFDPNNPDRKPGEDGRKKPAAPNPKPKTPSKPKGSDPAKPVKPKPVPIAKLGSLSTNDLIEQYKMADKAGRLRVRDAIISEFKQRSAIGDEEATNFLQGPDGPKMPRISMTELNRRIGRALRMLRSSPTSEEKQIYQDRIDGFNVAIRDWLDKASIGDLTKEIGQAQRELANARRDVKVYKNRIKQGYQGSYKDMLASAEMEVAQILGAINRMKTRIDELNDKEAAKKTEADAKKTPQIERNDRTDPPRARINREEKIKSMLDSWIGTWKYEAGNVDQNSNFDERLSKDLEFRGKLLDEFFADVKDPARLARKREWSYIQREFEERNGYNDLSMEERRKLANSDRKLLEDAINPELLAERIRTDYENWLQTSDGAYDLAVNYSYDDDSLFEIYMDSGSYMSYRRDDFVDMYKVVVDARRRMKDDGFDGVELASVERPQKPQAPDPKKPPVPYRAKDGSASELRKELKSRDLELVHFVTSEFGDNNEFSKLTEEEKKRLRDKWRKDQEYNFNLKNKIANMAPDRSKSFDDANDLSELVDIMANRNPSIKGLLGWHEPDGPLAQAMEEFGVYGDEHKGIILDRVRLIFGAAERMSDEYPDVPFDSLDAQLPKEFSEEGVIAHCRRHISIAIQMNTKYIVSDTPAPGRDATGFHPPNFADNALANVVIHEFGHSIDWFAFGLHDLVNEFGFLDRQEKRGVKIRRDQMYGKASEEIFDDRDDWLRKIKLEAWERAKKEEGYTGSLSQFVNDNTSGYAKKNLHELIAESWQDYHANGKLASPISIAVSEWVIERYKQRVKEGKKPYDLRTTE